MYSLRMLCASLFLEKGKPEPLKFELQGYWSRRLDQEHRLVYKVLDDLVNDHQQERQQ